VAAGNDSRFTDARTPTGTAGGDLSGTYPNPTVGRIQGRAVASTAPTNNQVMTWNNGATQWQPISIATILGYTPANGANYVAKTGDTMSGTLDLAGGDLNIYGSGNLSLEGGTVTVGFVGGADRNSKLTVAGTSNSRTNIIASGSDVDLSLSHHHILEDPDPSGDVNLVNLVDGAVYTVIVAETTSRTYNFLGCDHTYFSPANDATDQQSTYTIMSVNRGGVFHCYITWITGFQ